MTKLIFLGLCLCAAACTAPQGKKIGMNSGVLPDVAVGPTEKTANIGIGNYGSTVALTTNGTLTVTLPATGSARDGYAWRLGEIPDPTVLKRTDNPGISPGVGFAPPINGNQSLVFQGTGPGEVEVKMYYATLWASPMDETRMFNFRVVVSAEEPKSSKKNKSKKHPIKA